MNNDPIKYDLYNIFPIPSYFALLIKFPFIYLSINTKFIRPVNILCLSTYVIDGFDLGFDDLWHSRKTRRLEHSKDDFVLPRIV